MFGSAEQLLKRFSPDAQRHCTPQNECAIYTGNAPSLGIVTQAYGEDVTDLWLSIQLHDLANFSAAREKPTAQVYQTICDTIKDRFGYLKLSELLYFFSRYKGGEYGKFYGAVDPMAITTSLRAFCDERKAIIDKYRREQDIIQREAEYQAHARAAREFTRLVKASGLTHLEYIRQHKPQ